MDHEIEGGLMHLKATDEELMALFAVSD